MILYAVNDGDGFDLVVYFGDGLALLKNSILLTRDLCPSYPRSMVGLGLVTVGWPS